MLPRQPITDLEPGSADRLAEAEAHRLNVLSNRFRDLGKGGRRGPSLDPIHPEVPMHKALNLLGARKHFATVIQRSLKVCQIDRIDTVGNFERYVQFHDRLCLEAPGRLEVAKCYQVSTQLQRAEANVES